MTLFTKLSSHPLIFMTRTPDIAWDIIVTLSSVMPAIFDLM